MKKFHAMASESFPDAMVQVDNSRIKIIFPESAMFNTASADILPEFEKSLQKFAQLLNKYPKTILTIIGFTDSRGEKDYNMMLSYERSGKTRAYLEKSGVDNNRLFSDGLGENYPRATNFTSRGRAKNRRVEFEIRYSNY